MGATIIHKNKMLLPFVLL